MRCLLLLPALPALIAGAQCPTIESGLPPAQVANGYKLDLVANGYEYPRGIIFDKMGHLLVVDQGVGIFHQHLQDDGAGCVRQTKKTPIVMDSALNHGIQFSADGETLFASTVDKVYSYPYNPKQATAMASKRKTVISGMFNSGHSTRTLEMSKQMPGMLIVSRGSMSNIDPLCRRKSTGHCQLKVFNTNNMNGTYDFTRDGKILGWGVRNDVGVAEHPRTGGIWAVENSADQIRRMGKDIHELNPAEKLNYFGTLKNNKSPNQGKSFGYPECFAAWSTNIPSSRGLQPGMQFSLGNFGIERKDKECQSSRVAPRLVFNAHTAPLDIKFNNAGSEAWITYHGSWNRDVPVGFAVSMTKWADGEPTAKSTSTKAEIPIIRNADTSVCYSESCMRPVGLAWDPNGRLFFSSDATGQIYVITKSGSTSGAVDTAIKSKTSLPAGGAENPQDTGLASAFSTHASVTYAVAAIVGGFFLA